EYLVVGSNGAVLNDAAQNRVTGTIYATMINGESVASGTEGAIALATFNAEILGGSIHDVSLMTVTMSATGKTGAGEPKYQVGGLGTNARGDTEYLVVGSNGAVLNDAAQNRATGTIYATMINGESVASGTEGAIALATFNAEILGGSIHDVSLMTVTMSATGKTGAGEPKYQVGGLGTNANGDTEYLVVGSNGAVLNDAAQNRVTGTIYATMINGESVASGTEGA